MRRHSFTSDLARRGLGLAGVAGLTLLVLCSGSNLLTRFSIMNTAKADDCFATTLQRAKLAANASARRAFHSSLGDEGAMPDLDGATGWLNSPVLSRLSLRGKVVLINFWTFTCINSLRPMPYPHAPNLTLDFETVQFHQLEKRKRQTIIASLG